MAVHLSLKKGRPHTVQSDLDERELYAIGFVTVAWAMLEHMLLAESVRLADEARNRPSRKWSKLPQNEGQARVDHF